MSAGPRPCGIMLFRVLFNLDERLAPGGTADFFARRIMTLEWFPLGKSVKAVVYPVPFVVGSFGEALVSCTPPAPPRTGQRLRMRWGTIRVGEATIVSVISTGENSLAIRAETPSVRTAPRGRDFPRPRDVPPGRNHAAII